VLDDAVAAPGLVLPERFSIFRSTGAGVLEESRAVVARLLTPFRLTLLNMTPDASVSVSAAGLGPISLVHARTSGHEVRVQLTEQVSYYDINFALVGHNRLDCGDEQIVVTPTMAGIISPGTAPTMHLSDGYSQLHLRIERAALERRLEHLLGRPIAGPIRFRAAMDLTAPAVASWVRAVRLLLQDLGEPSGMGAVPAELSPWPDFIMTGLLLAQPHDHFVELAQLRVGTGYPRSVRRVVELIDRAPAAELSLTRLAAEAGVGPRSLQRDFRAHVGLSPREYVQLVRLDRAHEDLVAAAGSSVAEIAFRWGFTHPSRFAGAYLKRFGEPPSAVLRRARSSTGVARRMALSPNGSERL
jgi:AraC-like DNA-binding protein